jgi:hypothetical protein
MSYKTTTINIGHLIYRAEDPCIRLPAKPQFYGTKESAIYYLKRVHVWTLKTFEVIHNLQMLDITKNVANEWNFKQLLDSLTTMTNQSTTRMAFSRKMEDLASIQFLGLLGRILFGLDIVVDTTRVEYLFDRILKNPIEAKKYVAYYHIISQMTDCLKGRVSIRKLDHLFVAILQTFIQLYHLPIDGFICIKEGSELDFEHHCCKQINKGISQLGDKSETCTPSEICIFNPQRSLHRVS